MHTQNWQYLIKKYLDNSITREELSVLLHMIDEQEGHEELKIVLQDYWNKAKEKPLDIKIDWDRKLNGLFTEAAVQERISHSKTQNKRKYLPWLAAASVAAIIIVSGYLFFPNKQQHGTKQPFIAVESKKDIPPPVSSNAILTLANGQTILLDSASKGSLATQGNTHIEKLSDGEIAYQGASADIEYNTLTVPRGSKIASVILSDGTKVWLNSASSLKYPVSFTGKERKVEVTGEAYFEVAHNPKMPFEVRTGGMSVSVLGTHFNVNAYEDEALIRVTLLEGAVQIKKGKISKFLKPGEQARVSSDINIRGEVDVDEVMAWKNGKFQFGEGAEINSIMRQISRWYNVELEYRGEATGHIGGTISREENVSQVLKMLEMTGAVKFQIDTKKIIVIPNSF